MSRVILIVLCFMGLGHFVPVSAQDEKKQISIAEAIEEFNRMATIHPVGHSQPPLTEAEVIAAIRGCIPGVTPGVTDEIYDQLQEVAENKQLPEGTRFSPCSSWKGYRGYDFTVWWIDLLGDFDDQPGFDISFRIRSRMISSAKMTPDQRVQPRKTIRYGDLPNWSKGNQKSKIDLVNEFSQMLNATFGGIVIHGNPEDTPSAQEEFTIEASHEALKEINSKVKRRADSKASEQRIDREDH